MALNPSTLSGRFLKFESSALPPNTVALVSFSGTEAISRLYRFEVELVSDKSDIDLIQVLQKPAYIGIKQGVPMSGGTGRGIRNLQIHGTLSSFEQGGKTQEWVSYRAVLVPRLWKLTLNVRSRIFLDKKVTEIVEEVLKDNGFTSDDYEFKTASSYPKHEYVVQYQESDFNFICRQLEHAGAFFYFVHGDEREKLIVGDSASHYDVLANPPSLSYGAAGAAGDRHEPLPWFDPEVVRALNVRSNLIPGEVVLRDYNWRTPSTDLKVASPVVPDGFGTVYEYGNHYKDSGEGEALAKVRAEELNCRQVLFAGIGDCRAFRAGTSWELAEHYRPDFNQKYLVTAVSHKATQSIILGAGSGGPTATYENEFTCIPASLVFRPERTTPKPRIQGTINAKVDAGGSGQYAEIDDHGRYKVQIPFDLSGKSGGQASRFLRMAQPYAGANMGMHFPLHKGTEVAVLHSNGDPDRPFIAGAIPNPETGSVVCGGNQTQCVIRTGGDNKLVIDDDVGRITMSTPTANTLIRLGEHSSPDIGLWFRTAGHWISQVTQNVGLYVTGAQTTDVKSYSKENIHGMKNIWIGGLKLETIVGSETKQIIGMENKTNVGVKNEITLALGLKMGASAFVKVGPIDKDLKAIAKEKYGNCKRFVGTQADKIGTFSRDTAGKMRESAAAAAARFGKWKTDVAGPWITKTAAATVKTAKATWTAADNWVITTSANISQKASKLKADVGQALVDAKGTIKLKGAGYLVSISGGLTKIGTKLKILK